MTEVQPAETGRMHATGSAEAGLPERIRVLIGEEEVRSERLIGWAQLLLTAIFALLYLVAPRPADAGMGLIGAVPLAILAYGLFTLARLAMSYRMTIPAALLVASIAADIALLLGLIWIFHQEYGQTAAFSLKVPTFLYLFVFISLRALRFDYRFVLAAGIAAALGWAVVVLAVLWREGTGVVTRGFVDYLTSNRLLLGAEFDKVFAILMVTAILTYAVMRARRMLVTAVREAAAAREISRFLSRGLAETIKTADRQIEAGTAMERTAAILMLDIRGFTRFSTTVPPRDVVAMLTEFHAAVLPVIQRHGGVVDKFLGDGVMATFGAVRPSGRAAAEALAALDAIMAGAGDWERAQSTRTGGMPLAINAAVAAGPVLFATLGSGERLEYTVIGEAVNLAAKLEKHNKAEGTRAITTAATFELARSQGYAARSDIALRSACSVNGVAAPLDLAVLA